MLRMADIPVTYFGVEKKAYRSEEGIVLQCEHTLDELDVDDYDGILLSGFMEENPTILKNELLKEKLRIFDQQKSHWGYFHCSFTFIQCRHSKRSPIYVCHEQTRSC